MFRRAAVILAIAALCGCGRMAPLSPAQDKPLPVKPLMAATTPTAEELLTPPVYANPERADELIKRSQPRPVDRRDANHNPGQQPGQDGGQRPAHLAGSSD